MIVAIIKGLLFSLLLIYAACTDIKKREIDDYIWALIVITSLIGTGGSFMGGVLTALPFFIPAMFVGGSMGGGDIKLMFACGTVLGVGGGVAQIIIGLSFATMYAIYILVLKGYKAYKKTAIPLAPFLCVGGILSYLIINIGGI